MTSTPKLKSAPLAPAECRTMTDVRAEIDRLDREIVALLSDRLGYIARAGEIKPDRDLVRDEWRIEDVVTKVRASAEANGADPALIETVYRLLIDRSIAFEFDVFDQR